MVQPPSNKTEIYDNKWSNIEENSEGSIPQKKKARDPKIPQKNMMNPKI